MSNRISMVGRTFGRLTVTAHAKTHPTYGLMYSCRCECGNAAEAHGFKLRAGQKRSCGCLKSLPRGERHERD